MPDPELADRISEYEKRRTKLASKREALDREIADIDGDLVALRRVHDRQLLHKTQVSDSGDTSDNRAAHGDVRVPILQSLEQTPAIFTFNDVLDAMVKITGRAESDFDKSTISSTLKRLSDPDEGVLEIVQLGAGRRPTSYKKRIEGGPAEKSE